ncbi:hypothetical protein ACWC9T_41550, partial [Kitasatospora sp. NPDC001159]
MTHRTERLHTVGALARTLGGRAIHPVNVRLGGFHRLPTRAELDHLATMLRLPPTAQNQSAIEADLRAFVQPRLHLDDAELTR